MMTELQLYKFIQESSVEVSWRGDLLLAWIEPFDLSDFCKLLGYNFFEDGGRNVNLQSRGVICIELNDVCDYFGIEPEKILEKDEK